MMQGMGQSGEACPFEFNFDPASFTVGDLVSYRVTGMAFPFAGTLVAVEADHVVIQADPTKPDEVYRGTRESRPVVAESEVR